MENLRSRVNSLAFSSGTILFGRLFGKIANVAGLALLAKELSGNDFGLIMLAYTIATVIGLMSVFGMPNGFASLLPKFDSKKKSRILFAGSIISISGSVIGALMILMFRSEISSIMNEPRLTEILIPFALFALLFGISKSIVGILRGYKLSIEATLSRDIIAEGLALMVLIFWFLFWKDFIGVYIYWSLIPMTSIICGLVLFFNKNEDIVFRLPVKSDYSEILRFSWPLTVESSLVMLMSNMDVLLIGVFLTASSAGIYKAAQPIAMSMTIILTSFTFLYLPLASEMYEQRELSDLNEMYKICTKWVMTFSIPITAVIIAYAGTILETLYGSQFSVGADALSILAIGVFLRTFFGPNGAMIKAISRTTVDLYASIAALLVNLGLNLFLIPRMGIEGAAVATAVGFTIFNLIEVIVTYGTVQMHPISKDNILIILTVVAVGIPLRLILDASIVSLLIFSISVGIVSLFAAVIIGNGEVERDLLADVKDTVLKNL